MSQELGAHHSSAGEPDSQRHLDRRDLPGHRPAAVARLHDPLQREGHHPTLGRYRKHHERAT